MVSLFEYWQFKRGPYWSSHVAPWVKDLVSLQRPGPLLWHGFNPWLRNFCMLWEYFFKNLKVNKQIKEDLFNLYEASCYLYGDKCFYKWELLGNFFLLFLHSIHILLCYNVSYSRLYLGDLIHAHRI